MQWVTAVWPVLLAVWAMLSPVEARQQARPNILWITSEDNGPHLGAFGDDYAVTPSLDRLASMGVRYLHVWSTAPVCAPARTAIISGLYPSSTGSEHMRSMTRLPAGMKMYPQFLREAGYYCTNNSKEDYNLEKPGQVWDDSSRQAHWKNRRPGQPFFAIFNHTVSHESQIRIRPHELKSDPARVRLPAYHPDTPEVRRDWAQYYDKIAELDALAGENLRELEEAGLLEDTIVFYYSDHGSGMPRSKRWPYNSGLHVPLIVYIPDKFRHLAPPDYVAGGTSERMICFVDLAPTLLSLAGIRPPEYLQGGAFMGTFQDPPREYVFGLRGRMDERYDLVRSVRDTRYIYIRNYMPHRIYGQYLDYMFQTSTTRVWRQLYDEGRLSPPQTFFWETKPPEELYDLETDPDEVRNLAGSAAHREILERLRVALRNFILETRDAGFLPEAELHARSADSTPYELARDRRRYPLERILAVAEQASSLEAGEESALKEALRDGDSAARYWAAMGLLMRGSGAVASAREELGKALDDPAPSVRIAAAEALARHGGEAELARALDVLADLADLERQGMYVALQALNALDAAGPRAAEIKETLQNLPRQDPSLPSRLAEYVPRLLDYLLARLP